MFALTLLRYADQGLIDLDDGHTLADYNIQKEYTLELMLRQRDFVYIDENGEAQTANGVTVITSDMTSFSDGWYAVTADTEISDRILCDRDVYLILFDGVTLTAPEGIAVNENDCLTIYGQAVGDGTLEITGSGSDSNAGIGGDQGCRSGVITINSGTVKVNIDNIHYFAAAIGGEDYEGWMP